MKKAKYVDPTIGPVGAEQTETSHGGGKTHPGACVPGGMVQLSPDTITGGDNGTGYNYCNNTIEGFSFNHLSGIGWYGDLGNIQIMPVTGETDLRSGSNEEVEFKNGDKGWKSPFSHDREIAKAGYYSVELERYSILAEATVAPHTGLLRFTYPQTDDARVIFNFSRRIGGKADFEEIKIINDRRIEGTIHCSPKGGGFGHGHGNIEYDFHFVCEFSVPCEKMQFFANEKYVNENITCFEHEDAGMTAFFKDKLTEPLVIKCAVSYVDIDGARNNFNCECEDADFDKTAAQALESWEKVFEGVDVEGYDETDLKLFYTCLYHTLLDPRTTMDCDGRYTLCDKKVFNDGNNHLTVFSGWDVYRSEFPLLGVIRPQMVNDAVNSLLRIACERNTSFPRWELLGVNAGCMVGDPGLIVVADAYLKGIRNYDVNKAYDIARASSDCAEALWGEPFFSIRPYCSQYTEDAFVPEKLSDTLEYLMADYTMYKFAVATGNEEDAKRYKARFTRYTENYNPELGFMAPRYADGRFVYEENEYDDDGCVESNIFQQHWFVPYDVKGLSKLMGEERTLELLDRFFSKADLGELWNDDYNHSNEPCHNITHYFNILGIPHKTQYWTRRVQKEAYRTGAFGFCGNEDVGQLSAWYVLSAMGFAQVCPGNDEYYINTPLFRKVKIKLDGKYHSCKVSDVFMVECDKDPLKYPYIKSIHFNGEKIEDYYLTYWQITSGGVLKIELTDTP